MNKINITYLKTPTLIIGVLLLFSSCDKKEREQLKAEAQLLEQKLQERDSAFNEIMNVMAEVEASIEQIKEQENLISNTSSGDFANKSKKELVNDLQKINALIENTNEKVASLSSKLESSNIELNAFKRRTRQMTKDLEERESSLAQLREEIENKNQHIAELNSEVNSLVTRVQLQTETIDVQNEELKARESDLNTAYYAVNTEQKLKEEGLVTKEGGFLWLGKTLELKDDVPEEKFTEVNIHDTKRFYIDSDKMNIVTDHPSESYKLVNEDDKIKYLEVTDPSEFWKISKYLVVSKK